MDFLPPDMVVSVIVMHWWFTIKLWRRVMLGLICGALFGFTVVNIAGLQHGQEILESIRLLGDIFIRLIKMVVVPLIFFTLISGVVAMADPRKLGSIGLKAFCLYLLTTLFANCIGLAMGLIFQPGRSVSFDEVTSREPAQQAPSLTERLIGIIPENPVAALAEGNILAVIFFSLLFGIGILMSGERGKPVGDFFTSAGDAMLNVTHLIMELAPFGVFALIAHAAGTQGTDTFLGILRLVLAVYAGCILHIVIVYGGLIHFGLRLPVRNFFRGILDAQMVAYSTTSSSATLPVTISNVIDNLGVRKSVASSVLPLGATINMDGTALYLGVLALFTAQAFGYTLQPHHYLLIMLVATLASIGAAGVPAAALFLLAGVLSVFDVSPEHTALILGIVFPFDRLLDMMRTLTNVSGDATVTVIVARWERAIDEERYRAPAVE